MPALAAASLGRCQRDKTLEVYNETRHDENQCLRLERDAEHTNNESYDKAQRILESHGVRWSCSLSLSSFLPLSVATGEN